MIPASRRAAVRAAEGRGELRDVDLEVAVDLLAAPFYDILLVTGSPITHQVADTVVDAVLAWVHAT